jgi:hypothetical protein
MRIEISDEVWELWTCSWALLGVKDHKKLVEMLEVHIREESIDVLEDSETQLLDDLPEAFVQRQKGILKEKSKYKICEHILRPLKNGEFCNRECERDQKRN